MNFKKTWKRFFSLSRQTEGFTLVELIVVIAILAILAGVGVPAYSGYVEKANKGVDETLAGEIKQALWLAHYSGKLAPGTSVIVYYGDTPVVVNEAAVEGYSATSGHDAMVATFGDSYTDLRLASSDWDEEIGVLGNGDALEYVEKSNFTGDNLGYMLDDVQLLVGYLTGAVGDGALTITENDTVGKYLTSQGISLDKANAQQIANVSTMFVADYTAQNTDADTFANFWANPENGGGFVTVTGQNTLAGAAAYYANMEAIANYIDKQTNNQYNYAQTLRELNLGTSSGTVNQALIGLQQQMVSQSTDVYMDYYGLEMDAEGNPQYKEGMTAETSQAYSDGQAYLAYMKGLSQSADSLVNSTDTTKDNYYADGTVQDYVTNYISLGDALQEAGYAGDGAFAFIYTGNSVMCAPLDY